MWIYLLIGDFKFKYIASKYFSCKRFKWIIYSCHIVQSMFKSAFCTIRAVTSPNFAEGLICLTPHAAIHLLESLVWGWITWNYTLMHTVHCTTLDCTVCTLLHYTDYYTTLHCTVHCSTQHCPVHCTTLHCTVHCTTLHSTAHCNILHCTAHCTTLNWTVHWTTPHLAVHCTTLTCILHCTTLDCSMYYTTL